MARKASKDLKFTQVKKESKLVHHKETHEFDNGTSITFNPVFAKTEIQKLFENLQKTLVTVPEEIEINDKLMEKLVMFHIIRQFTHFKNDLKEDDFVTQLGQLESLIDMEVEGRSLFSFIMDDLFDAEQVMKVFDGLSEVVGASMYLTKFNEQAQQHFEKLDIKNRKVFENLKLN